LAPATPQPVQTASLPAADSSGGTMAQQAASVGGGADGARITVQPGDTIHGIARRYGVPADTIMRANGMSPSDTLRSGSKILIPGVSADSAARIASASGSAPQAPKAASTAPTPGSYK